MVKLHVKKGDESLFLFETVTSCNVKELLTDLVKIYNGRLKIERLCFEIDEMSKYGVSLPTDMQGLTSTQISDLKLNDLWAEKHLSPSDYILRLDPMGKRNGKAPLEKYADVLTKTTAECKARISKKLIDSNICLSYADIQECLDILRGAVTITYPMGLPTYEVIWMELEGKEDLSGTQASKEILEVKNTDLWCCNKQLEANKILSDYIGKNEKSKLIVKLQKKGLGAPAREPALTEQQRKDLMLAEHRRREELKKLEMDDDDSHLDSQWADNDQLKKCFHGLSKIKFK
ncbi:cilia- and flagella-associated protein 298-like [Uloborus diversus]|uniref:cilia- and flagella-associated protein 298-like n=1 Tax=Uloborus diversus TaxID=327109 RepID=UPI00240956D8|nr:cilia- and flagella-associated protein 298-like [Uloborus diversus]